MKGIILSEFVEFLEESLGPDQAQTIIEKSGVQSQGAYSRVGQYDYQELIQLLTQAVAETNMEAGDLVQPFADHLFTVFHRDYNVFFEGAESAAHMLTQIDDHNSCRGQEAISGCRITKIRILTRRRQASS